jgi:hypothetical protein
LKRLQIRPDPLNGLRPRLSSVAEVEDKTRIADRIAAESGRCDPTVTKILFNFSKQIHDIPH